MAVAANINFQTTNPAQLIDRVTELQVAVTADEVNNLQVAEYTSAGAIKPGGVALLKTGAASAFTLVQPLAGPQLQGGQDFMRMKIIALDAHAYTVTTAADGINGADDTATCGAIIGQTLELIAFNGVWYSELNTSAANTAAWTLSEV